uniref:RNA-binding region-containing protein 3 n=1 Tax=Propithecus coquereli TaxID=379532 RepID=A0A2K6ES90_PROCO
MAAPEQPLPLSRGCPSSTSLSPPRGDRTLLVRHLPAELTAEEKEDLLKYFGAQSVRVLSDKGRLKHTAFATFPNEKAAIKLNFDSVYPRSDDPVEDDKEKKELGCLTIENGIAPNHGLTFPLNSCLKYMYPPPSSTILANIVNALASVPKFYVQVSRMKANKSFYLSIYMPKFKSRMNKLMELANLQPKRPKTVKQHHVRKKRKIKDMLNLPATEVDAPNMGFGKIFPKPNLNITEEIKEDSDEMPSECISRRELEKGRISREGNDLKFIFGRYVDFSSETQRIMFDIRLMKEGRMKGQAFIGLPNEKAAAKALKEANGYVLFGKPMVV